jgi:hypothetical protein
MQGTASLRPFKFKKRNEFARRHFSIGVSPETYPKSISEIFPQICAITFVKPNTINRL